MQARLRAVREESTTRDSGFTLIEMLVVVVIIGILASISVPLYLNYRKGAENKAAESDVRGAIAAVEAYYTENNNTYPASRNGTAGNNLVWTVGTVNYAITVSTGNTLYYRNATTYYVVCGQNASGRAIYLYNSSSGRPVGKSTQTTLATCLASGT